MWFTDWIHSQLCSVLWKRGWDIFKAWLGLWRCDETCCSSCKPKIPNLHGQLLYIPQLLKDLYDKKTYGTETMTSNQKGLPDIIKEIVNIIGSLRDQEHTWYKQKFTMFGKTLNVELLQQTNIQVIQRAQSNATGKERVQDKRKLCSSEVFEWPKWLLIEHIR